MCQFKYPYTSYTSVHLNQHREIMKPQTPEYSLDMPSTAGTYTRHMDSIPTGHTPATSRESPSLVGSEAHMVNS